MVGPAPGRQRAETTEGSHLGRRRETFLLALAALAAVAACAVPRPDPGPAPEGGHTRRSWLEHALIAAAVVLAAVGTAALHARWWRRSVGAPPGPR